MSSASAVLAQHKMQCSMHIEKCGLIVWKFSTCLDVNGQAWELAADPRISVGKKKCLPPKIKRSAQIRM